MRRESEQVLQATELTGKEFDIFADSAEVSLEPLPAVELLDDEALSAAFSIDIPDTRVGQLQFTVSAVVDASTIAIVGVGADGTAVTETLTWSTGDNAAMTTTNTYASITSATPSGFASETVDVTLLASTIAGNWVVQSSRRNAAPRRWSNEFEPGDALTADIPIAQVPGSNSRVYRVTGGTVGVEGWVDDLLTHIFR